MRPEEAWNDDVISDINGELIKRGISGYKTERNTVIKEISVGTKNNKKCFKIHFAQRDIIIFKDTINAENIIREESGVVFESISHTQRSSFEIPVPEIIVELKYEMDTSDTIFKESSLFSDIKRVFPSCIFILLIYNNHCMEETLERNGAYFDKIFFLKKDSRKLPKTYSSEYFKEDLNNDSIGNIYKAFLEYLILKINNTKIFKE